MLSIRLFSRNLVPCLVLSTQHLRISARLFSSSDSSDSDSDTNTKTKKEIREERKKIAIEEANERITKKINTLLESMVNVSDTASSVHVVTRPMRVKTNNLAKPDTAKNKPFEAQLVNAAKNVATTLGGDVQQTEAELLNIMLSPDTSNAFKAAQDEKQVQEAPSEQASIDISELLMELQVDNSSEEHNERKLRRIEEMRDKMRGLQQTHRRALEKELSMETLQRRKSYRPSSIRYKEEANLFSGTPLGIFQTKHPDDKLDSPLTTVPELSTWEALQEKENLMIVTQPPSNYFEEMIDWTLRGKLWHFPINNEQGLEKEEEVHFSEHVFMERHLKDWCPRRGPIRHFMELVCVGLSKNPYMTVNEKKEHIMWFKDYFGDKQNLLKEMGALDNATPTVETKQIDN